MACPLAFPKDELTACVCACGSQFAESGATGFIKAINPTPVSFSWGGDATEAAHRALAALEEQIIIEGPETIAGVLLESIGGSAGVYANHPDYMLGVRALCDKYGMMCVPPPQASRHPTP